MSTNIKHAKAGSAFPPMEAGTYPAVCCGVIDLGRQKTSFEGREKDVNQILLIWEFPDELIDYNGEMKPRWQSRTYTFSVNEKARLRQDLRNWRGRDFTESELADFDIARVLAAPCMITITQTSKNGQVYANMSGVSKLAKGMPPVKPPLKKLHFDIDDDSTWPTFAELPEWIQQKINNSLTFKDKGIQLDKEARVYNFGPPVSQEYHDMGNEVLGDEDLPF